LLLLANRTNGRRPY